MRLLVHPDEVAHVDPRVPLRRRQRGVPEHLLDRPEVRRAGTVDIGDHGGPTGLVGELHDPAVTGPLAGHPPISVIGVVDLDDAVPVNDLDDQIVLVPTVDARPAIPDRGDQPAPIAMGFKIWRWPIFMARLS